MIRSLIEETQFSSVRLSQINIWRRYVMWRSWDPVLGTPFHFLTSLTRSRSRNNSRDYQTSSLRPLFADRVLNLTATKTPGVAGGTTGRLLEAPSSVNAEAYQDVSHNGQEVRHWRETRYLVAGKWTRNSVIDEKRRTWLLESWQGISHRRETRYLVAGKWTRNLVIDEKRDT
jgi:hypothetical protein